MDVRFENISNPWSPGARVVQPWLHRQPRRSERQAAFPFGTALPRYLLFYNPRRRNRWGHPRSYRIQHSSHAGPVLPRGWQEEKGVSWGRWGYGVGAGGVPAAPGCGSRQPPVGSGAALRVPTSPNRRGPGTGTSCRWHVAPAAPRPPPGSPSAR